MESAPSEGPTVRSSRYLIEAGNAPARSTSANSCALSWLKFPSIMPVSSMRPLITGADWTLWSRTIAILLPRFCSGKGPKRLAACGESLNRRLGQSQRVDAARDGLERLRHRGFLDLRDCAWAQRQRVGVGITGSASQVPDIVVLLGDQVAEFRGLRRIDVAHEDVRVVDAAHFIVMNIL